MIEEITPEAVRFKIFGIKKGATVLYGNLQFVDGMVEVHKTDAVNIERALRPYSACLESEWEDRQAEWEEAQAQVKVIVEEKQPTLDDISHAKQEIADVLEKIRVQGEEFDEAKIALREAFEIEKAEAIKQAIAAYIKEQAQPEGKPTTASKAGVKDDGNGKDNKSTK